MTGVLVMYRIWKCAASVFVLLSVAVITPDFTASGELATEPFKLTCKLVGNLKKTFGGTEW